VPCKCSLDGNNGGYCSSIIGTNYYKEANQAYKTVKERSDCHTLDRDDLRAQKDSCGIQEGEDWELAVEMMFAVKYWPYVQNQDTFSCIKSFFFDSIDNLKITGALELVASATAAALVILFH